MRFTHEMSFQRLRLPEPGIQPANEQPPASRKVYDVDDADAPRRIIVDPSDVIPAGTAINDEQSDATYIEDTGLIELQSGTDTRVTGRRRVEISKDGKSLEESFTIKDKSRTDSYFHIQDVSKNSSTEAWGWSGGSSKPTRSDWRECTCRGNKPEKPCRHVQARIRDGWGD